MICSNCSKTAYSGDIWMRMSTPLIGTAVTIDLAGIVGACEKFCSKECALEYIEKNNIEVVVENLTVDMVSEP